MNPVECGLKKQKKYIDVESVKGMTIDGWELDGIFDEIPAADVQEVKHAHWEDEYYDEITELYYHTCSNCNTEITATCFDNYCPNCGAIMDGKENEK